MTERLLDKTGDRQDDYLHIHGSKVIVLSVRPVYPFMVRFRISSFDKPQLVSPIEAMSVARWRRTTLGWESLTCMNHTNEMIGEGSVRLWHLVLRHVT